MPSGFPDDQNLLKTYVYEVSLIKSHTAFLVDLDFSLMLSFTLVYDQQETIFVIDRELLGINLVS